MADLIETQMNVIGSLFIDIDYSIKKVYTRLKPEHFTHTKLKKVYATVQELYTLGKPIDVQSVANHARTKDITELELSEILRKCVLSTPTTVNIEYHANELIDNYKSRLLRNIVSDASVADERNVNEVIGETINKLSELAADRKTTSKTLKEIYEENKHKYFNENYDPEYLNLGFDDIDRMLSGIEDTDLVCIAARPSIGKSAFVTQIAYSKAKQGRKTMFYNLEMNDKQVIDRILCSETKIPFDRIRHAKKFMSDEELRFRDAESKFLNCENLIIDDCGTKTVREIRNECKYIDNLGLIIIDYLQLLKPDKGRNGNKVQEIGDISRGLKAMAMELKVPVIALSQMSRSIEGRPDKEPVLADLRESGDIEQDCNSVIFLYEAFDGGNNLIKDLRNVKVAKSRQGETGKTKIGFMGKLMTFYSLDKTNIQKSIEAVEKSSESRDGFMVLDSNTRLPWEE
ncbi:replicative DNA helicase [Lachnotalea glycerini]|uniref:DNA 5'-3' helicase n=1 Tax=Lachnotalea glycerini TaxID=1763509 RepID=A0A318EJZ9_9FIRM|nr:DnaB-like helicase C-terminal domain-containing protein [Lachnotalea glycerini]PXV88411.1 replicative DNA helicase [Lachnotalea glycerini]